MIRNYFYLNRYVIEIDALIAGSKIIQVFSQEKGKLVISCTKNEKEYNLEFSAIPGQSYLNLREKYSRAKKNTIDFYNSSIGNKIKSIKIADDDRIVKIECSYVDFYFAVRGKFTNVFYMREDENFEAFKNLDEVELSEIKNEFLGKTFTNKYNFPDLSLPSAKNYLENVKKNYPVIGGEIIKEVKSRENNDEKHDSELEKVINEVMTTHPALFVDEYLNDVNIAFDSFISIPFSAKEIYDDLVSAQNLFISKKHYFEIKNNRIKLIERHLEKGLKKLSNKINGLQGVIERGSREEEYSKFGNLLLVNLHSIKAGMSEIEVEDIYKNKKIKIKLNPKLPAKKNIDYWFDKSKAEKIGIEKSVQLLKKAKTDYENLKKIEGGLIKTDSLKELDSIIKELKIKSVAMKAEKEDIKEKFKHYIIDEKYHVFVGKDSKNNDLLTAKFAKQNDYWFHARSVSGSHVVLRVESTKETVPKNVLKKAAALAAYHSKAKTAGVVPVAYTFKKYVVKKKGDPIGTVHLLREDVLLVRPEIPKDCEFIIND